MPLGRLTNRHLTDQSEIASLGANGNGTTWQAT